MAAHQNSSVTASKLTLGNYKIETAAYSATAHSGWVNLGAGMLTGIQHVPTFYETQAGNAPDPIEGVSSEIVNISFELIEYDASAMSPAFGGLLSTSSTTTQSSLFAGGNTQITDRAFKFTNSSIIGGATKTTVYTFFKGHVSAGLEVQTKSDNDADPINIFPIKIECKCDESRTVGSQLFSVVRDL